LPRRSPALPFGHHIVTSTDCSNVCSFFAEAHRIATEDYVPSIEDIGHASEREGVVETHFNSNHYSIRISQVYGQVGCLRKWIPVFDGITSVMFCASLADYDEPGVSGRGGQVCIPPLVFPSMRVTKGRRHDWLNLSPISAKSSTPPGSLASEHRSYYS